MTAKNSSMKYFCLMVFFLSIFYSSKSKILSDMDTLRCEMSQLEAECDELRLMRQDASRELLQERARAQEEAEEMRLRLEEQVDKKGAMEQTIGQLREEVSLREKLRFFFTK